MNRFKVNILGKTPHKYYNVKVFSPPPFKKLLIIRDHYLEPLICLRLHNDDIISLLFLKLVNRIPP